MAYLKIPTCGAIELLKMQIQSATISENMIVKLYTGAVTIGPTTTAGSFTESSFDGYSSPISGSATILRGTTGQCWSTPTTVDGYATATSAEIRWKNTGSTPVDINGYYVTNTSGVLLFAQQFDVTRTLAPTDELPLAPSFSYISEN